jgi:flagellar motor switch protein FliN
VRDIMALHPGSVIVLDRSAGSPVDVLVNGSLVWHGEVVVVDDEFGIRVSEIVIED